MYKKSPSSINGRAKLELIETDPVTSKLPESIIKLGLIPFNASIILSTCSALIILPGSIPSVEIVPLVAVGK
jgi:hypothetical protein